MDTDKEKLAGTLPNVWIALIPIITLVILVTLMVKLFGSDSLGGPNQLALLIASGISVALSMWLNGMKWEYFTAQLKKTIGATSEAIMILLAIGMIGGSWMAGGVVPTLICYGLDILSPKYFLVCSCIICAFISVLTGSSWSTIATIGIALMGIGTMLGIPQAWTAGAIISGAYFGDKISPLSDTTVLASSVSETDIFVHIRYMLFTTVPSILVSLAIFTVAGLLMDTSGAQVQSGIEGLKNTFNISAWTLLVPLLTGILISRRVPALATLFISAMAGIVSAILFEKDILVQISGGLASAKGYILSCATVLFGSTSISTGDGMLDELVSTGGMAGMLDTIWLILCALCFGATMVSGRMLESITLAIIKRITKTGSLVAATVLSGITMNLTTSDQYLSVILTANTFKDIYKKMGYKPELLSRTTEDAVTVTSVLIPWNTCGMTQSTILGVSTITYLPYCFFNLLSPVMTILVAILGWKIRRFTEK